MWATSRVTIVRDFLVPCFNKVKKTKENKRGSEREGKNRETSKKEERKVKKERTEEKPQQDVCFPLNTIQDLDCRNKRKSGNRKRNEKKNEDPEYSIS